MVVLMALDAPPRSRVSVHQPSASAEEERSKSLLLDHLVEGLNRRGEKSVCGRSVLAQGLEKKVWSSTAVLGGRQEICRWFETRNREAKESLRALGYI